MEQAEFLEQHVFTDLNPLNDSESQEDSPSFSEADFEIVLQRVEHYGISIYSMATSLDGVPSGAITHEDHRKKATDPKWYKKAFMTFKKDQAGLVYSATYKVSPKLLAR